MYEPQHLLNLQDNGGGYGGDANSWLSAAGEDSPATHRRNLSSFSTATSAATATSNFDPDLFKDLVGMVPLVQSLIDRNASSSFTRRGSMIYTKTPSREMFSRKAGEKGRNTTQSNTVKKRRDLGDSRNDGSADDTSMLSSIALQTEKDREELIALREQVKDLQRQLSEKDEILKSLYGTVDELKTQNSERESILKSTQIQLSDAKIKLADKQAALEKLQWEALTSNKNVVKLQEDINTMQGEISSFMLLFEGLSKNDCGLTCEEYDITPFASHLLEEDVHEMDMLKMEDAREAYVAAVAAAKEKQDEESIAIAALARSRLLSFVTTT